MSAPMRFAPGERCPLPTAAGVGIQGAIFALAPLVLVVAITARAGGQDDDYLSWAVFAALIIAGGLTALQAVRFGRIGAGHVLIMGTTPNFVAVSVLALQAGGPALLASLVVVSSLFYLALANWLPALRRVITPIVSGTALMLIAVAILPIAIGQMRQVQGDAPEAAAPVIALVTLVVIIAMALRAGGVLRLWSPLIGIAFGCAAAAAFGAYDLAPLTEAAWFGIPAAGLAGFDVSPDAQFLALLPVFVVITLVGAVKNIGDSIAAQQASQRGLRATDFRSVQGSLNVNGLGVLLSGLAGTPPTTVYSATSVALMNLTGVASRNVGYMVGVFLVALAFLPKLTSLLLAIPSAVLGTYILTATGLLFAEGLRTISRDGLDFPKMVVVGISFALGAGIEQQSVFADLIGGTWGPLLDNGMLIGSLTAVALTLFLDATNPRRPSRLKTDLGQAAFAEIDGFVHAAATRAGWDQGSADRLRSAAEETLHSLMPNEQSAGDVPRLVLTVRPAGEVIELEFVAAFDDANLEDRLAHLEEEDTDMADNQLSMRLLGHYAAEVQHRKYFGLDVVAVQVRARG
ncbi:MAG: hypothetical protein F4Z40_06925 [Chloroflexi bacterium]|nr:hypothetical protein [Chloroflexota bacterium]